jgi:hypothetical protein
MKGHIIMTSCRSLLIGALGIGILGSVLGGVGTGLGQVGRDRGATQQRIYPCTTQTIFIGNRTVICTTCYDMYGNPISTMCF